MFFGFQSGNQVDSAIDPHTGKLSDYAWGDVVGFATKQERDDWVGTHSRVRYPLTNRDGKAKMAHRASQALAGKPFEAGSRWSVMGIQCMSDEAIESYIQSELDTRARRVAWAAQWAADQKAKAVAS